MAQPAYSTLTRSRSEILDRDVELGLATAWLDNNDYRARDRLVLAYRPLAVNLATAVARQSGMVVEDLVQEAFLALAESTDKFDPSLGNRFGTFARWHIMGQLRRHVMDFFGPCRIGTNLSDKKVFMQFRRLRAEIEAREQRPLDERGRNEIAERIGVPRQVVDRMEPRLTHHDVSLDEPLPGEDGDTGMTRSNLLVDDGPSPETGAISRHDGSRTKAILKDLIDELPERERAIVMARLMNEDRVQLAELGERHGITKERVRQLERKALRQLRRGLEEMGFKAEDLILSA